MSKWSREARDAVALVEYGHYISPLVSDWLAETEEYREAYRKYADRILTALESIKALSPSAYATSQLTQEKERQEDASLAGLTSLRESIIQLAEEWDERSASAKSNKVWRAVGTCAAELRLLLEKSMK